MTNSAARRSVIRLVIVGAVAVAPACHLERARNSEGLESATLPEDMREDYALFAQRCSKCHSLARPLQSGISDDEFWQNYVERMRRQPGSGITPDEAPHILRFLHYYSGAQRSKGTVSPGGREPPEGGERDAGEEPDRS